MPPLSDPHSQATATASLAPHEAVASLRGVCKHFGQLRALDGLYLQIPHGIVGLLGPNGAGKSTLFRLLLGLDRASSGELEVLRWPMPEAAMQARAEIGYMPEDDSLFPNLRGTDQIVRAARLCGLNAVDAFSRAHQTLDLVGLSGARYQAVSSFSLGMRQRLRLAMALVHGPRLLLLDEPTAGLDPDGRAEMLRLVKEVGEAGVTIVLSTHVLGDIEATCDHVILLSRGRANFNGPMASFRAGPGRRLTRDDAGPTSQPASSPKANPEANPNANPESSQPPSIAQSWSLEIVGDRRSLIAALKREGITAREHKTGLRVELSAELMPGLWRAATASEAGVRQLKPHREEMSEAFVRHLELNDPTRRQARAQLARSERGER